MTITTKWGTAKKDVRVVRSQLASAEKGFWGWLLLSSHFVLHFSFSVLQ